MKKSVFIVGLLLVVSMAYGQVGIFTNQVLLGDNGLGDAKFANNAYAIGGGGSDIWGTSDGCTFLYKEITGNWMITVDLAWDDSNPDVLRGNAVNDWRKMGIMVREEPEVNGSRHVFGLLQNTFGADLGWRDTAGGDSGDAGLQAKGANDVDTLRLVRMLNNFSLLRKQADGSFRTIASHSLALPTKVYWGFAVTAHDSANYEVAKFSNVTVKAIDAVVEVGRTLPVDTFLANSVVNNIVLDVTVETGKTTDISITETLPVGWTLKSSSPAATKVDGNKITWDLKAVSGKTKITYTANTGNDKESVVIGGTYLASGEIYGVAGLGGLDLEGADQAYAPKLNKDAKLDGKISAGEYDGAYVFNFDRVNDRAPGVLLEGKSYTHDQSNATVYVYHNDTAIYVALDMVDPAISYQGRANQWENDSCELYMDGNYNRGATKENGAFGFQATVLGDGSGASGNDAPAAQAVGGGAAKLVTDAGYNGNFSDNGAYWDFGARSKDDGTGYIIEWKTYKEFMMDPITLGVIGFDIGVNEADPGATARTGKWAWWHFDADTGKRKDAWNDERGWGKLELLKTNQLPGVNGWTLY